VAFPTQVVPFRKVLAGCQLYQHLESLFYLRVCLTLATEPNQTALVKSRAIAFFVNSLLRKSCCQSCTIKLENITNDGGLQHVNLNCLLQDDRVFNGSEPWEVVPVPRIRLRGVFPQPAEHDIDFPETSSSR
jgi:hypothetical protein